MTYHPGNLKLQPFSHEAVIELANRAAQLGVQFHIAGIPFGAAYDRELWRKFHEQEGNARLPGGIGNGDEKVLGCPASGTIGRAALSVVRENDKMGTSADDRLVPMPVLNDVLIYGRGYLMLEPDGTMTRLDPKTVNLDGTPPALPREVPAQAETGWVSVGFKKGDIVKHIDGKTYQFDGEALQPSDHRSAPAAHREPDLPSSLLTRLDCPGGLTKG